MDWLNTNGLEFGEAAISYFALLSSVLVIFGGFGAATKATDRIRGLPTSQPSANRWRASLARVGGYGITIPFL